MYETSTYFECIYCCNTILNGSSQAPQVEESVKNKPPVCRFLCSTRKASRDVQHRQMERQQQHTHTRRRKREKERDTKNGQSSFTRHESFLQNNPAGPRTSVSGKRWYWHRQQPRFVSLDRLDYRL